MEFSLDDYKKKLPLALRKRRRDLEVTQKELAKKAGVSEKTIIDIENKNFKGLAVDTIAKVCKALDISAKFVLDTGGDHD